MTHPFSIIFFNISGITRGAGWTRKIGSEPRMPEKKGHPSKIETKTDEEAYFINLYL